MRPIFVRFITVPTLPTGNFKSLPSQIGSSYPQLPVKSPRPLEHPQDLSTTVPTRGAVLEPVNDSTFVIADHL